MLPLQITLENFLSYRESVTLSFEGASLWMLAGANGAGKSSVFDAMRWTLFGAHRGGKSGHEALIHTGQTRLRVAFDLALGERRFRLIRTLARAGRATWQIEELLGGQTLKITEADGREGYEKWVRENIGLSDETFTSALYLPQNRGDALLGASPQARYEMLAEIVDISAYATLHERAKSRAAELENAAQSAKTAWENAPDAAPDEIESLGEKLSALEAEIARNSARRERVLGWEPLSARWNAGVLERNAVQISLEGARATLGDAAQIERDSARWDELKALLPPLERYAEARARAARNREDIAARAGALVAARAVLKVEKLGFEAQQSELEALEVARRSAENARLEAASEIAELGPALGAARQIAGLRAEIAALEGELGAFAPNLGDPSLGTQKARLEADLNAGQQELAARALWARFEREKSVYRAANSREIAAQHEILELDQAQSDREAGAQTAEKEAASALGAQTRAVENLAAARARRVDAERAAQRLEAVQNEANCSFCGQKLTPDHLEKERVRLASALENARGDEARRAAQWQSAGVTEQGAKSRLESAQSALRQAQNRQRDFENESRNARVESEAATARAALIFGEIDPDWQTRFEVWMTEAGSDESPDESPERARGDDLEVSTVHASGSADALRDSARALRLLARDVALPDSETSAHWLERQRAALDELSALLARRDRVAFRLADRKTGLQKLLGKAPVEAAEALFERETALQTAQKAAALMLTTGEKPLENARVAAKSARGAVEAAGDAVSALESQVAALGAAKTEIERALESAQSAAPAPSREQNEADLAVALALWQSEYAELASQNLAGRLGEVRAAQNRVAGLEAELSRLDLTLEEVPLEARRAPHELQNEAAELKAALERSGEAERTARFEKTRLEERRAEKSRLEGALLEVQNRAREYRTLADLLGPHQLQRFLLREAENGIIDEANAVLDRISGGGLRLELRADDEEIAGGRKAVPKVLDVAIFRDEMLEGGAGTTLGGGAAMLPVFLSGSQRFRVAVALALGIGRFATRGGGSRLEAVIIDEGFGALDKIGRGEMIEELQLLGRELQRVILVSHQEEFFEAFPNRYLIEKVAGASTARLMGG